MWRHLATSTHWRSHRASERDLCSRSGEACLLAQFVARAPRKRKARPESCTAGNARERSVLLLPNDSAAQPACHGASWPENVAAWSATSDFPRTREWMWKNFIGAANDEQLFIVAAVSSHCNRSVHIIILLHSQQLFVFHHLTSALMPHH